MSERSSLLRSNVLPIFDQTKRIAMNAAALKSSFFTEALDDNASGLVLKAEALVVAEAGSRRVVPCRGLDVEQFARLGFCEIVPDDEPRPSFFRYWGGEDYDRLYTSYDQVVWRVNWNGNTIRPSCQSCDHKRLFSASR